VQKVSIWKFLGELFYGKSSKFKTNGSSNKWMEWEIKRYFFFDDVAIDCKFMLEASRKAIHSCANCWGVGIGGGFFFFFFFLLEVFLLSLIARISPWFFMGYNS
jgi:hypothetical protein